MPYLALICAVAGAQTSLPIDLDLAARYFQEARWIAQDDNGALWGKSLAGPMIFVARETREAVASENPPLPGFERKQGVFVGKFPPNLGIANTAYNLGGTRWTLVMWPLPENRAERATLMMHELFHRIQPELGFPGSSPRNSHLETLEGRLWLQIEFRALAKALSATDAEERLVATLDALAFRAHRQSKFPDARKDEDALELNEGLAHFTGYMLRGGWEPESRAWLANQVRQQIGRDTYTRTFGYWTGSAYAFLLNVLESIRYDEIRWRKGLSADSSLAGMVQALVGAVPALAEEQTIARAQEYGYREIFEKEKALDGPRQAKIAAIRKQLFEAPVLILPLERMNISFDFRNIVSLFDDGTYYKTATLNNEWGTLEVTDGAIVSADFKFARVSAPLNADARSGPGWTLVLKPGWTLVPGERKGDYLLKRSG